MFGVRPTKCFSASRGSMLSAGKDDHPQLHLLLVYLVHLSSASTPTILAISLFSCSSKCNESWKDGAGKEGHWMSSRGWGLSPHHTP